MRWAYSAVAALALIAAFSAKAMPVTPPDNAAGARAFNTCQACHAIEKGASNGIGPNLVGVISRRAGSVVGFNYSAAMKNSGVIWDTKTLDEFLAAPAKKVPGTRMPISVPDPAKRAAIVAYLSSKAAQ